MNSKSKHSSLLEKAVANNDTRSLKQLLKAERYDFKNSKEVLTKAVEANNVDAVQLLLDRVVSLELLDALWVVFREAAKAGRDEFLRLTETVKLRDRSVPSEALRWAAEHGHNEWIKPLLDNGADVNGDGHNHIYLCVAAANGQVTCPTTLIEVD